MKNTCSIFVLSVMVSFLPFNGFAQGAHTKEITEDYNWLVKELKLSEEEASAFIPIFSRNEEKQLLLLELEKSAMSQLESSIRTGDKEIDYIFLKYIEAREANQNQHVKAYKEYMTILPVDKLFLFYKIWPREIPSSLEELPEVEYDEKEEKTKFDIIPCR